MSNTVERIKSLSLPLLVILFNLNAPQANKRQTKGFASVEEGVKKCTSLLEDIAAEDFIDVPDDLEAAQALLAEKTPQKPVKVPRTEEEILAARREGVRKSWENPEVKAKRAERHGVRLTKEGVTVGEYKSVREAFIAHGLNLSGHIVFRGKLKAAGTLEGYGFVWTVFAIEKPVKEPKEPKEPKPEAEKKAKKTGGKKKAEPEQAPAEDAPAEGDQQ